MVRVRAQRSMSLGAKGPQGAGVAAGEDYEEAGRQLLARLNLSSSDTEHSTPHRHLDAVWADPVTSAKVFIGDQTAARSEEILRRHGITHIINCQDVSAPNFHEGNAHFHYYRFPVAHWFKFPMDSPTETLAYFRGPHGFIEGALGGGGSVLVHCLAGAHRAGTTGVSWLMHAAEVDQATATSMAKALRPVVNPFGHLLTILAKLEEALAARRADPTLSAAAAAAAAQMQATAA
eukprot:COSAG01_NODE_2414_length_7740_cov_10.011386_2_plen_234_part_00